jgi:Zinc-binding dehydrogenase
MNLAFPLFQWVQSLGIRRDPELNQRKRWSNVLGGKRSAAGHRQNTGASPPGERRNPRRGRCGASRATWRHPRWPRVAPRSPPGPCPSPRPTPQARCPRPWQPTLRRIRAGQRGGADVGRLWRVRVAPTSGSIGSIVGQIAKLKGATVIGLAGSPEKRDILTDTPGFDHALDYRAEDFADQLASVAPNGADLYFDGVGGAVSDTVMWQMRQLGRVIVVGLISTYDHDDTAWQINFKGPIWVTVTGGAVPLRSWALIAGTCSPANVHVCVARWEGSHCFGCGEEHPVNKRFNISVD